ncbi:hypothetical protein E4U58_006103 [Claviceps cyperi]|nr:hypothetical protein E4U58_006103 [Claviceps cyperi]
MSTSHLLTGSQVRTQTMGDLSVAKYPWPNSKITNAAASIKSNAKPDGYSTFLLNFPHPGPKDSPLVQHRAEILNQAGSTEATAAKVETGLWARHIIGENKSLKPNKKTTAYRIRRMWYQNLDKSFLKGLSEAHSTGPPRDLILYTSDDDIYAWWYRVDSTGLIISGISY